MYSSAGRTRKIPGVARKGTAAAPFGATRVGLNHALTKQLSIRVALPRATMTCPTQSGSVCWGWSFDDGELDRASAIVTESAKACFGERPATLIGFSNGGYLVTALFRSCTVAKRIPLASRLVTIGAGKGSTTIQPDSLSDCGELTMLVGDHDQHNSDPDGALLKGLRAKGANVEEVQFPGGHALDERSISAVLRTTR